MFRARLKKFYDDFLSLKGSPHRIAISYSVGTAIGFSPFVGTHSILCGIASLIFHLNLTAVYLATWLPCNPLTFAPMIIGEYQIGRVLLMRPVIALPAAWTLRAMLDLGWSFIGPILVGWAVLAAVSAPLAYPIVLAAIKKARKIRRPAATENGDV